ncbi:MAG: hypothetical protein JXB15_16225 [Anaerolineales bacterium]|nr:hypothetical protein [Anaerolineales bacterium]
MKEPVGAKNVASASISLGNEVGKIERLTISKSGQEQIRFSIWSQGKMLRRPLTLTEEELVALLQAAIQEGILSRDFIGSLSSIIEI